MRFLFTALLFSVLFLPALAQKPRVIQLSGLITNDSLAPLPFVNVLVVNRSKGTISNMYGFFSFPTYTGDTLRFSSVGYRRQYYVVPDTLKEGEDFMLKVTMETDTILLKEAIVTPWMTYEQFGEALVSMDVPYDDYVRAQNNMNLIIKQARDPNFAMTASMNYRYVMQQHADRIYWAGQMQPVNLLNPIAWAKYFAFLKDLKESN